MLKNNIKKKCLLTSIVRYDVSMKVQGKHRVHKSNDLVEAKFKLPLLTQRIMAMCISKINPRHNKLHNPYRFSVKEYCELSGSTSDGMHEKIKDALDDLKSRVLRKYDPDLRRERLFGWVDKIDIFDNQTYDIYFHSELESDLVAKTKYTSYFLETGFQFKSKYSMRLYEIAKKWEKIGKVDIPVHKLRLMMGLDEGEYTVYGMFKKRCFEKAINDINKNSELHLEFEERKIGRKVEVIDLTITKKNKDRLSLSQAKKEEKKGGGDSKPNLFDHMDSDETDELIDKLGALGLRPRVSIGLIDEYGIEKVKKVYEETNREKANGKLGEAKLSGVIINKLQDLNEVEKQKAVETKSNTLKEAVAKENQEWYQSVKGNFRDDIQTSDGGAYLSIIQQEDGSMNRTGLGNIVYSDPQFREKVSAYFV